jgi:hypothetical protein
MRKFVYSARHGIQSRLQAMDGSHQGEQSTLARLSMGTQILPSPAVACCPMAFLRLKFLIPLM